MKKTFAKLSREAGIDEKTIKNIFEDYVHRLGKEIKFETPEFLGIDELKIIGEYRCLITNVNELAVYDLLPNRRKTDLMTYFKAMPDKHKIKVVTMDMWRTYKDVVNAQLPGRDIVVDRWYVIRMANEALEAVRKQIRKGLNTRQRLKLKDDRFILWRGGTTFRPSSVNRCSPGSIFIQNWLWLMRPRRTSITSTRVATRLRLRSLRGHG